MNATRENRQSGFGTMGTLTQLLVTLAILASLAETVFAGWNTAFAPKDPYRIIGNTTNAVNQKWDRFYGVVLQVQTEGIRVRGLHGKNGQFDPFYGPNPFKEGKGVEFFVKGFPYPVADDDFIEGESNYYALQDGLFAYDSITGKRTLHCLNYGKVYRIPQRPIHQ